MKHLTKTKLTSLEDMQCQRSQSAQFSWMRVEKRSQVTLCPPNSWQAAKPFGWLMEDSPYHYQGKKRRVVVSSEDDIEEVDAPSVRKAKPDLKKRKLSKGKEKYWQPQEGVCIFLWLPFSLAWSRHQIAQREAPDEEEWSQWKWSCIRDQHRASIWWPECIE